MKIILNDEPYEHAGDGTVAALLREIGADQTRVAVVVNADIVPRLQRAEVRLKEGDRVDVVAMAGGG